MLAIVPLVPFEITVVPAGQFRVVSERGDPMSNVLVKQEWKHVTTESEMHVEFVRTNINGVAAFPRRTIKSSLLRRMVNSGWRILTQGVHASIGSYGTLTAYSDDDPRV